ncbi:dermonecrotic toxin domain-containing protein [Pseudomonas sp. NY11955]|uniref:dermonecrotic toxin domain-containing protein n=1 Tax=Pseudomonas sp. NY11955 TaxID=3400363 RepID=UPI003A8B35B6
MASANASITDLKQACARQFADRPTLRQVTSQQVFALLLARLPSLAGVQPMLTDANPLRLIRPAQHSPSWQTQPLVDVVLQALLDGTPLDLRGAEPRGHFLGLADPYRFRGSDSTFDTLSLNEASDAFNALLLALPEHFRQAQIDYWNSQPCAATDDCGVSQHRWMQQALRTALLGNVRSPELSDDARMCLYDLLSGRTDSMQVSAIEVTLSLAGQERLEVLADLLVSLERDERHLLLWCSPSGRVDVYASFEDFSLDLRDRLALRHDFDRLIWSLHPLSGDPFLQQSGLLLGWLLQQIESPPWQAIASLEQMEAWFAQASDPSAVFFEQVFFEGPAPVLPGWLAQASSQDRFEYQVAMLDMAVEQAQSKGATSLDGVPDLHTYASQRLREQMLADYPQEANYFADDLILTVQDALGVPGGAAIGAGDGVVSQRNLSLTDLAIGNLGALGHGSIVAIRHRENQLIMGWMNADYLKALVAKVDIGGHYPQHVSALLDDPLARRERIRCHAREWRMQLLFDALRLKVEGGLWREAWQALAEFCRSGRDLKVNVDIAPLAFKVPGHRPGDTVRGMFVIRLHRPNAWLLYCPYERSNPLRAFAEPGALVAGVRGDATLQQRVLSWLGEAARGIYQDGGFLRPRRITGWTHTAAGLLVPLYEVVELASAKPAELKFRPWLVDVDAHLFGAKQQMLIELADRQSVSNAQRRWSALLEAGGLLFNVLTPVLRGPVAVVAWLVSTLVALGNDLQRLGESEAQRSMALMDIVGNLSILLAHSRLPQVTPAQSAVPIPALIDAVAGRQAVQAPVVKRALAPAQASPLMFPTGWGPGPAAQLRALQELVATVDLSGVGEDSDGFYRKDGQRYVELLGERFEVRQFNHDVRMVGPGGQLGPWLWRGEQWKIRTGFLGGMPKPGRTSKMQAELDRIDQQVSASMTDGDAIRPQITEKTLNVIALEGKLNLQEKSLAQLQQGAGTLTAEQLDKLVTHHKAGIASKQAHLSDERKALTRMMEQAVAHDRTILTQMPRLLELQRKPGIRGGFNADAAQRFLETARRNVVVYSCNILGELKLQAGYPELHRISQLLKGEPITSVHAEYQVYRNLLRETVGVQARMIQASIDLDAFMAELPPEAVMVAGTPAITKSKLLTSRQMTTVDIRFHQAMNYRDLVVDLNHPSEWRASYRYSQELAPPSLTSAASAHSQLLTGNVSAGDRIEILQNAWDEYSTAIINSIDIASHSAALVDADMLKCYAAELNALKLMVGEQLQEAVAEQDGVALPARYPVYVKSLARQLPVRTRKGELVVASWLDDERLEVRDAFTHDMLHRFEADGHGGWVEVVAGETAGPQPFTGEVLQLQAQAEQLLADQALVERKASEYIEGDVRGHILSGLVDDHLTRLRQVASDLQGVDEGLAEQARKLIELWSSRRTELLLALYDRTQHPDAEALSFMHQQGLVRVDYQGPRKQLRDGSAVDEYLIRRLPHPGDSKGRTLWVAHFHFANLTDSATDFTRGHLKTWRQRFYGSADAQKLALRGERIHRGPLTYAQARGIIPFR